MEEKQKKVPAKRIQLVDVLLERKGSQMFEDRRVRSPEDAANIIQDFIGDSDRENFVVFVLNSSNNLKNMGIRNKWWNAHSFSY